MGGSSWNDDFYTDRTVDRVKRGVDTFDYSRSVTTGKVKAEVHDNLNIRGKIRESRDSDAHPESTAIGIMFDVTGSMGRVPRVMQEKLPKLMSLLLTKGYIQDPQILFGAVGDYFSDKIPLQIGQFESGIEMDDDVTKIVLEGGGGGSFQESYQNALYYFANRTSIDCFEKRGKKGYLFMIGDEQAYTKVSRSELDELVGDGRQTDVTLEEIVQSVQEKYNVFFIIPKGSSYYDDPRLKTFWDGLLGSQRVIKLDDPEAVCETIGLAIGLNEGTVDPDTDVMKSALKEVGATTSVVNATTKGLDAYAKSVALARSSSTGGTFPSKKGKSSSTERI